jgi:hypothetical protein
MTPGVMIPGCRVHRADQRARRQARASRAKVAAYRAVITITADHPSWGDARVVRRTARCGNVEDDDGEPHPLLRQRQRGAAKDDPRGHVPSTARYRASAQAILAAIDTDRAAKRKRSEMPLFKDRIGRPGLIGRGRDRQDNRHDRGDRRDDRGDRRRRGRGLFR